MHRALSSAVAFFLLALACLPSQTESTRTGVNCRALKNPLSMASRLCLCQPCHVCEFSWRHLQCGLITNSGVDTTDGSSVKLVQPTVDPSAWFLDGARLTAARGGVPRPDLSVFTEGNQVTTFSVGNEFFKSVLDDVQATKANASIYLAAWSTADVPFDPVSDLTGAITGFKALFTLAIQRGVDFKALVWQNLLERDQNLKMRDYFNGLVVSSGRSSSNASIAATGSSINVSSGSTSRNETRITSSNSSRTLSSESSSISLPGFSSGSSTNKSSSKTGRFIFDDRLPGLTASHHQKTLVIQQPNQPVIAYVGGIDLTSDRWDTMYHNNSVLRKQANIYAGSEGWLDGHFRIVGPAALDVGTNFVERWNSKTPNSQDLLDGVLQFKNPLYAPLPQIQKSGPTTTGQAQGTAAVQITRTFSCQYDGYKEFAPKGERSLFHARLHAIQQAKNYIYVEDQYFIQVPELLDALLKVLPRLQRLIVVIQPTSKDTKITGYEKYLFDMVSPLQSKFPNKFQLYTTKKAKNLYIHSKILIIDDVFLSIGSANWNRRSMTSDSEIGANVVDRNLQLAAADQVIVAQAARDYRIRKFMELTGKNYKQLDEMKFLDAANTLDAAVQDPSSILDVLEVQEKAAFAAIPESVHDLADPDDSC